MRAKLAMVVAALVPLIAATHAVSADPMAPSGTSPVAPSPAGLWQAVDNDTKQPTGWFLITDHNGVYDGIIARMFLKPGEDPNVVCDQCKDDRHDQRWLGLEIIRGMKQEDADKYGGGTILDPRDGKIYHATMKAHARRPNTRGARLYRHRAVGRKSILGAAARFRLQHARPVG